MEDSGNPDPSIGTLIDAEVTGLGMAEGITYFGLEALNISLGSGSDLFTIESTHAGITTLATHAGDDVIAVQSISGTTTIDAGEGLDTIDVHLTPSSGETVNAFNELLTVHGGADTDTLNVDTAFPLENAGSLTDTELTGLGMSAGFPMTSWKP